MGIANEPLYVGRGFVAASTSGFLGPLAEMVAQGYRPNDANGWTRRLRSGIKGGGRPVSRIEIQSLVGDLTGPRK